MNQAPPSSGDEDKPLMLDVLFVNNRKIDVVQTIMFIIGGIACGTLGLTSLRGLLFFLFVSILIALGIAARMGFKIALYANMSFFSLLLQGITSHILSFVLFWTLSYALVYIY